MKQFKYGIALRSKGISTAVEYRWYPIGGELFFSKAKAVKRRIELSKMDAELMEYKVIEFHDAEVPTKKRKGK